jgi:arginase
VLWDTGEKDSFTFMKDPFQGAAIILHGMTAPRVAVFGVPSAAGARSSGVSQAPLRLREAGLLDALRANGATVVNLSDLSLFPFRDDPEHAKARNAEVVACAVKTAADEMTRAMAEGFTVVLGGDCTLVAGVVAGARRHLGQDVGLVYLDADADLNTPETTPSGFLHGMALALALGRGPAEVVAAMGPPPYLQPDHVSLVGFRALDAGERAPLGDLGLALPAHPARRLGMTAAAALALDGVGNGDGPVVVHVDVDVIDPKDMPAKAVLAPGEALGFEEVADLLTRILASPRVVALLVCEYEPDRDDAGLTCGRRIVELVSRAVARRLRV